MGIPVARTNQLALDNLVFQIIQFVMDILVVQMSLFVMGLQVARAYCFEKDIQIAMIHCYVVDLLVSVVFQQVSQASLLDVKWDAASAQKNFLESSRAQFLVLANPDTFEGVVMVEIGLGMRENELMMFRNLALQVFLDNVLALLLKIRLKSLIRLLLEESK